MSKLDLDEIKARLAEAVVTAGLSLTPAQVDADLCALVAEVQRLREERYRLLSVETKALASEWLSRTANAEARRDQAEADAAALREAAQFLLNNLPLPLMSRLVGLDELRSAINKSQDSADTKPAVKQENPT